jgi:hypothetical protein
MIVAGPVFSTVKSLEGAAETLTVLELLPGVGSGVLEETLAVLETLVPTKFAGTL